MVALGRRGWRGLEEVHFERVQLTHAVKEGSHLVHRLELGVNNECLET